MSAESPHKSSIRGGHVVAPQPVSDRSIIESVAGFINEVVPQAYTSLPASDSKECITWARFEYADINDPALYPDTADERSSTPPLLLVLGYGSGVQVWAVPANGEAREVLSWRQGVVRTLRILPTPLADSPMPDAFGHKRPLVALCDSAGPGPQFCSLSFISLRAGDQVKSIKFKNPINDVLANRRSIVITFPERIAVFDACTLEDRLTVTTCYPCPGPNPNPVALGTRWLAYAERRLLPSRRSSGGTEGEGVQSYTATVLHAAKSLGKGLRELGESVASSLTGSASNAGMQRGVVGGGAGQQGGVNTGGSCDSLQPGIITILDAQGVSSSHGEESRINESGTASSNADLMVAHFMAHGDPVVALAFDPTGMLLLTADKRGHDFHLFRIQPHPGGPSLAAVHHLYILHRGDTTAKVQDIAFAADSRWVAVSTLRGTTHVFPITPYGGPVGIRTHTTPHVVNRLSRFHRSAGLTADGRNSPVPSTCPTPAAANYESIVSSPVMPYPNPRLPPYPHPTVIAPLAQIRQPMTHPLLSGVAPLSPNTVSQQAYHRNPPARALGRSQSLSDEGIPGGVVPLRMATCFAPPRAWLVGSPTVPRDSSAKARKRAVDSLFVMACHGSLIEYDLEPKHVAGIPKEKVCDDTPIELEVHAKAQWLLLRPPHSSELQPPLSASNPLMVLPDRLPPASECRSDDMDERWLSQVEIVTHAGPHRRLWMGPQFTFKTYNAPAGTPVSLLELEAVEVGTGVGSRPARSNPVNMPLSGGGRPIVPVLIESGSASSYEQSPRLVEVYGGEGGDSDGSAGPGDTQLREDLADAMMESPGIPIRDTGGRVIVTVRGKRGSLPVEKVVNPVGTVITVPLPSDEDVATLLSPAGSCQGSCTEGMVRWPTAIKTPEEWPTRDVETEGDSDSNNLLNFKVDTVVKSDNECSSEIKYSRAKSKNGVGVESSDYFLKKQRKNGTKLDRDKDYRNIVSLSEESRPSDESETKRNTQLASKIVSKASEVRAEVQCLPLNAYTGKSLEEPSKKKAGMISGEEQKKEESAEYQKNGEKKKKMRRKTPEDCLEIAVAEAIAEEVVTKKNKHRKVPEETDESKIEAPVRKDRGTSSKGAEEKVKEDSVARKSPKKLSVEAPEYEEEESELERFVLSVVDRKGEDKGAATTIQQEEYEPEGTALLDTFASEMSTCDVDGMEESVVAPVDKTIKLDLPPLKSWSNIVSDNCSKSPEDIWTASNLSPAIITSTFNIDLPSSSGKDCNEKADGETLLSEADFPTMGRGSPKSTAVAAAPQRSWSSVVSSLPKAGTSADEGSGEYDSNESKESADLGLDELEERPADSITDLVNKSSSEKPAIEDEAGSEPSVVSTKKSRRAKKKRR
ncbi:breast carcinoma-amplified sequence 3 homolog [Anabrus simplex]|uniref:breast carcinoma-amplified sequence 3 homolog n=1 Tax=Anabrus simplex TaxID=316456 RepID=UPI0035A2DA76